MKKVLKQITCAMRLMFIGFIGIYTILKIFDVSAKTKNSQVNAEEVVAEFDDLW